MAINHPFDELSIIYNNNKNYEFYKKIALELVKEYFPLLKQAVSPRPSALELGCGSGISSEVFIQNIPHVQWTLLDSSEHMLNLAKNNSHLMNGNVQFLCTHAENTNLNAHTFDYCFSNLSAHWFNLELAVKEISRILKKDGYLFLSLPLITPSSNHNGNAFLRTLVLYHRKNINRSVTQGLRLRDISKIFKLNQTFKNKTYSFEEAYTSYEEMYSVLLSRGSIHAILGTHLNPTVIKEQFLSADKKDNAPIILKWSFALIAVKLN